MSDRATGKQKSDPSPSLWELVLAFNQIALASFGGGLSAWSREIVVVEKKWMHEEEFLSAATMCRILPGANQVNMAVFIGTKFHGIPGAIVAVFGLCAIPVILVLGLAVAYFQFHQPMGRWPIQNHGEEAVLLCFIFLFFAAHGAGPWSVDQRLRRK